MSRPMAASRCARDGRARDGVIGNGPSRWPDVELHSECGASDARIHRLASRIANRRPGAGPASYHVEALPTFVFPCRGLVGTRQRTVSSTQLDSSKSVDPLAKVRVRRLVCESR